MLPALELEEIKALQEEVEQADLIHLKLNWDMLRSRTPEERSDYVCRKDGRIVAFLGLYDFAAKVEVCGMVAPSYRRQGIFTALLREALPKERADGYKEIWLNTPGASASGLAFVKSVAATPGFTEYQMKYDPQQDEVKTSAADVALRTAGHADQRHLIALDAQGFGLDEQEAGQIYMSSMADSHSQSLLIEYKGEPAGKLRVSREPQESWIYGFVVYPHLRGQGVGRSALSRIVKQEHAAGRNVFLEVALENKRALKLYESCGFTLVYVQDYFSYRP